MPKRGCQEHHPDPEQHRADCYVCNLYVTDVAYRELMDADDAVTKPPTALQMVAQFAAAVKAEWDWRRGGGAAPTAAEKATRRTLCDGCAQRDPTSDSCTPCGCYLEAGLVPPRPLGKLGASTQSCPVGKWGYAGGYVPKAGCGGCGKAPAVKTASTPDQRQPSVAPPSETNAPAIQSNAQERQLAVLARRAADANT